MPENKKHPHYLMKSGRRQFSGSELDDKVILKTDGMPTYHLANIVDDHLMEITHVIQRRRMLPKVRPHVLMYEFLDGRLPVFHTAH